jgi:uncharacterized protein with von Willebrand factor type A (vWA) domain
MSQPFSDHLLEFIAALRAAGVRVSVAESLDAMRAVTAAGLSRSRLREALRAALVKDAADDPSYDSVFLTFFQTAGAKPGMPHQSRGAQIGLSGHSRGQLDGAATLQPRPKREPAPASGRLDRSYPDVKAPSANAQARTGERSGVSSPADSSESGDDGDRRHGALRRIERTSFERYSDLEYSTARDVLGLLQRRLRVRLGRRMRLARRGRIDFRRTLRAATQRGGALIDLRYRARRPRHIDLLVLADISGSVHYASTLMLELIAGAKCFRRMRAFVFVDRLAAADFEQRHLVMSPLLDLYARSDFGRVFAELRERHSELLTRATVLVIMGDGRNNRRPPRADLLRDISRRCRSTVWLNPEAPERWGTGDSAIESYRRVVDLLLPSGNLRELEAGLGRVV